MASERQIMFSANFFSKVKQRAERVAEFPNDQSRKHKYREDLEAILIDLQTWELKDLRDKYPCELGEYRLTYKGDAGVVWRERHSNIVVVSIR